MILHRVLAVFVLIALVWIARDCATHLSELTREVSRLNASVESMSAEHSRIAKLFLSRRRGDEE